MSQKYPRKEKLKKKSEIDLLFAKGKWSSCGNLRIISLDTEKKSIETEIYNQKFGVSVSKKLFKNSVDRNRIKRLLREVYRLNKDLFISAFGGKSLSMLFWVSKTQPEKYLEVESEFLKLCTGKKQNSEKNKNQESEQLGIN